MLLLHCRRVLLLLLLLLACCRLPLLPLRRRWLPARLQLLLGCPGLHEMSAERVVVGGCQVRREKSNGSLLCSRAMQ